METQYNFPSPPKSIWINANAGSGKTTTVINRILSFLLQGVKPQEILVITYTTNGVNEVKHRLEKKIAQLLQKSQEQLEEITRQICGHTSATIVEAAKTLPEQTILINKNIQVCTIHSFCYKIIAQSATASGQKIPEIATNSVSLQAKQCANNMSWQFIEDQYNEAKKQKDDQREWEIRKFLETCGSKGVETIISSAINDITVPQSPLSSWFKENLPNAGINPHTLAKQEFSKLVGHNGLAVKVYKLLQQSMYTGSTISKIAQGIEQWAHKYQNITGPEEESLGQREVQAMFTLLEILHTTSTGTAKPRDLRAKKIQPYDGEQYLELCNSVKSFCENYNSLILANANALAEELIQIAKQSHDIFLQHKGYISNNQILEQTLQMIQTGALHGNRNNITKNILHLFIDEAQDVSPVSWEIIFSLFNQLFQAPHATFSIVGDEKQSIFSFQGADINHFLRIKSELFHKLEANGKATTTEELNFSYRTGHTLLAQINNIFSSPNILPKISTSQTLEHISKAGVHSEEIVKITIPLQPKMEEEKEGWHIAHNKYHNKENPSLLSINGEMEHESQIVDSGIKEIINLVKNWNNKGTPYHDMMVLTRDRKSKKNAVISLTKAMGTEGIPCTIDKFPIQHHIVFQDLLTLIRAIGNPYNNATIATLLRSCFFQFSLDEVDEILQNTPKGEHAINTIAKMHPETHQRIDNIIREFTSKGITSALLMVVGSQSGYARILHLYGQDGVNIANRIIEITSQSWVLGGYNLVGLVKVLNTQEISFSSAKKGGVRISTIHSAKGSESGATILWDLSTQNKRRPYYFAKSNAGKQIFVCGSKMLHQNITNIINESEDQRIAEELRILYVATTRAKRQLAVVGTIPKQQEQNNWLSIITQLADRSD